MKNVPCSATHVRCMKYLAVQSKTLWLSESMNTLWAKGMKTKDGFQNPPQNKHEPKGNVKQCTAIWALGRHWQNPLKPCKTHQQTIQNNFEDLRISSSIPWESAHVSGIQDPPHWLGG